MKLDPAPRSKRYIKAVQRQAMAGVRPEVRAAIALADRYAPAGDFTMHAAMAKDIHDAIVAHAGTIALSVLRDFGKGK